jgi:hypothetical protein
MGSVRGGLRRLPGGRSLRLRRSKEAAFELERVDSADSPLAVDGLYAAVIVNVVALLQQQQAVWIGLLTLFALVLLLLTGLYLFVLPHAAKWRSG